MMKRFPWGASGIASVDSTGHPVTANGPVTAYIWWTSDSNFVDNKTMPMTVGNWILQVNEANPTSPFTISITIASGFTLTGPTIVHGTIVDGVEIGKQFKFSVARNTPSAWNYDLRIIFTPPTTGTVPWTLSDELLIRPGLDTIALASTNTNAPSQNVIRMITAANGVGPLSGSPWR